MRGRTLLKESSSPPLCAFCAHRLGQARRPSHIQRRFLQSSRPVAKPPGEASAAREEENEGPPAPTWGRPGPVGGNGFGQSASWGRPAVGSGAVPSVPAGPAVNWERPNSGAIGIPARPAELSRPPAVEGLLPHELRARELMLEKDITSQQRPLYKNFGPGPQTSRAGRHLDPPKSDAERMQILRREAIAEKHMRNKQYLEAVTSGQAGPRITKHLSTRPNHILGDNEWSLPSYSKGPNNGDTPRWTALKRRGEENVEERILPRDTFAEARARREEQAKAGGYTPLGSRSIFGSSLDGYTAKRTSSRYGERHFGRQNEVDSIAKSAGPEEHRMREQSQFRWQDPATDSRSTVKFTPMAPSVERRTQPGDGDTISIGDQASNGQQEERFPLASREERQKKSRSRFTEAKPSYDYEPAPRGKGKDKARRREQFVKNEEEEAEQEEALARAEAKKQRKREKAARKAVAPTPMLLPEYISVSNLAVALKVRLEDFVWKMEELGFEETSHNHILNAENAGLIAMEYGFEPIIDRGVSEDLRAREPAADSSILPPRPPVVTIMGHVDHGKTTLLDWLRKSSVAATEHGGITQHIGAFSVPMPSGKIITFLDTPGHAAFLSMRQRGANVTDIVILVVAADDSVKPQTIEAINHAKAAKVPIIVAINKVDKEEANIDRVKQDLARHGIDVEDFGGDTQAISVSGKTGQGMEELEEAAVTLSEILDMRAEIDGPAEGWVLEASIKSMGKVATVLVRRGTMRPGDFIVAGKTWARIRCLRNEAGLEIEEAGPGTPVEIDGWREQPLAGDEVLQAPDENKAKSVVEYRLEKDERDKMAEDMEAINENRKAEQERRETEKAEAGAAAEAAKSDEEVPEVQKDTKPTGPKQIYFIIKGDVSGSVEAVIDSISALGNQEVQPHILRSGVGQLSEFDIEHAAAAKGQVINFNTPVEPNISRLAGEAKVQIIDQNIIYRLVDDVKAELSKHLPPLVTQRVLGEAEIAQIFEINVKGRRHKNIAGCKVRNGTIAKAAKVRVLRRGEKVFDGTLASLKNVKKDVMEMKKGSDCGMGFEDWVDFQVGDQVQSYEEKEEKRYL